MCTVYPDEVTFRLIEYQTAIKTESGFFQHLGKENKNFTLNKQPNTVTHLPAISVLIIECGIAKPS